jgi:hypothetical protein
MSAHTGPVLASSDECVEAAPNLPCCHSQRAPWQGVRQFRLALDAIIRFIDDAIPRRCTTGLCLCSIVPATHPPGSEPQSRLRQRQATQRTTHNTVRLLTLWDAVP